MKYANFTTLLVLFISLFSFSAIAENEDWSNIKSDYKEFYSKERLIRMGLIFAGGAVLANTDIDQDFQNDYQNNIRSAATDDFSKTAKLFGEGKYLIPISLISAGVASYLNDGKDRSGVGKWGELTARAYLVGGPTVLMTQLLTGASRPSEDPFKSDWKPFNDSNGVSGHAFIGAVPFLNIAYMNKNMFVKSTAYIASTFAAISRINDNQHYLSQAMLGWYLAWESVDAVNSVELKRASKFRLQPVVGYDSYGLQISMQW